VHAAIAACHNQVSQTVWSQQLTVIVKWFISTLESWLSQWLLPPTLTVYSFKSVENTHYNILLIFPKQQDFKVELLGDNSKVASCECFIDYFNVSVPCTYQL